jgi:hypothetical protein
MSRAGADTLADLLRLPAWKSTKKIQELRLMTQLWLCWASSVDAQGKTRDASGDRLV